MSSRLFQEIREKRGLAYAVRSYVTPYMDTGLFGIYAGTSEEGVSVVLDLILEELKRLRHELLTEKEVAQVKELIKGNFLLSMESTDSRMIRLAKNEISFGRYIPEGDVISAIDAVTAEDVRRRAFEMFMPEAISVAATGRLTEKDVALDSYDG
jgi:predicted Zn-dependent peptidase